MKNFKDKVIIITGAGSGIGRELVIQLVKKRAIPVLADINEAGMLETVAISNAHNYSIHQLDMSVAADIKDFVKNVLEIHGRIDVLINNAGIIQPFVDFIHLDEAIVDKIMQVNFYGPVNLTRACLPYLLERPEAHIANISSMGGFIPFPGQTIYGASKAAIKLFTEGLYAELKETNVGVSIIHPGAISTNIITNSGITKEIKVDSKDKLEAAQRSMPADKAAIEIIEAITDKAFRALVGKDAKTLDKIYRLMPQKAVDYITKQMKNVKQ